MVSDTIIDLPTRDEIRYCITDTQEFLSRISPHFKEKEFSRNEFTQTIYFNNEEQTVPFGVSLKARRYIYSPDPSIDENFEYFFDEKIGSGNKKTKKRTKIRFGDISSYVNQNYNFLGVPLRPYFMVVYHRNHYVPADENGIRLTLDIDMDYFFLPGNKKNVLDAVYIGHENTYSRLEVKEKNRTQSSEHIKHIVDEMNLIPIISKKCKAYYFVDKYNKSMFGKPFVNELPEYEIESKLAAESEETFHKVKDLFRNGYKGFVLSRHYPYTVESSSIHRYYEHGGSVFKVLFKGNSASVKEKTNRIILIDPLNVDCIFSVNERKVDMTPEELQNVLAGHMEGEIYKAKKCFYLTNEDTGRFYHVSFDRCSTEKDALCQMEVEYTGNFSIQENPNIFCCCKRP
ncbi:hypothetical protein HYZ41_04575 [archaeon]|nr:hypothetical protein [archaeon]